MPSTDPIADLLTRIRNAARARKMILTCPASSVKEAIAKILKEEKYIDDFKTQQSADGFPEMVIHLNPDRLSMEIKRISKPGRRVYVSKDKLPRVLSGLGIALISTPKGVMTNRKARAVGIGGEVLCEVW